VFKGLIIRTKAKDSSPYKDLRSAKAFHVVSWYINLAIHFEQGQNKFKTIFFLQQFYIIHILHFFNNLLL